MVIRECGLLKRDNLDIRPLIKLLGNPAADIVHLNTGARERRDQGFRGGAEEVPCSHARLEDRALIESHVLDGSPNRANRARIGIVRVLNGLPGRGIFFRGQQGSQFVGFLLPAFIFLTERILHASPARVLHEHHLLFWRGHAALGIEPLQESNGCDILLELRLGAPDFDLIFRRDYVVVAGWRRRGVGGSGLG